MDNIKNQKSKQEILDEMQDEIVDNLYGKKAKRRTLLMKLGSYRIHLIRILVISVFILFVYLSFKVLVASPRYTDVETGRNAIKLEQLIDGKTGNLAPRFHETFDLLKKYPKYYKKVVNNIQDIRISSKVCPYACIYAQGHTVHSMINLLQEVFFPDANYNKKNLSY